MYSMRLATTSGAASLLWVKNDSMLSRSRHTGSRDFGCGVAHFDESSISTQSGRIFNEVSKKAFKLNSQNDQLVMRLKKIGLSPVRTLVKSAFFSASMAKVSLGLLNLFQSTNNKPKCLPSTCHGTKCRHYTNAPSLRRMTKSSCAWLCVLTLNWFENSGTIQFYCTCFSSLQ
jgi:hypothetical protein